MSTAGRVLFGFALSVFLVGGCLKPAVIHVDLDRAVAAASSRGYETRNYQAVMESLVVFMREEMDIPFPARVSLYLYPNQGAFMQGLEEEAGFAPISAARTAGYASAVATTGKVLVNEIDLAWEPWKRCVEVLAHELIHVSQRYLAGGRRGWSVQWLREGFAEWAAMIALDRFGLESREVRLAKARGQVRWVSEGGDLPPLRQLMGPSGWAAAQDKPGGAASYELALLATGFLIDRVGVPPVIQYFRNSGVLDGRGNFAQAFGLNLFEFEVEFATHLEEILR